MIILKACDIMISDNKVYFESDNKRVPHQVNSFQAVFSF